MNRETIINLLTEQVIEVTFTKKDGSTRVMLATLDDDYLPESTGSSSSAVNLETVTVWDIEESAWRSFRIDNILSIEYDYNGETVVWSPED